MNEPKIEIVNVIEPILPHENVIEISLQEVGGEPHLFRRSKGTTLWESFARVRDLLNPPADSALCGQKPTKCGWAEIPNWATHWTPLPDPPEGK